MFICGVNFDNTERVRNLARERPVPAPPRGTETFTFNVGETCYSTPTGVFKPGVSFTIVERYMQHGYAYYRDSKGVTHRTKDIQRNP